MSMNYYSHTVYGYFYWLLLFYATFTPLCMTLICAITTVIMLSCTEMKLCLFECLAYLYHCNFLDFCEKLSKLLKKF